jgi:hypothetical protein
MGTADTDVPFLNVECTVVMQVESLENDASAECQQHRCWSQCRRKCFVKIAITAAVTVIGSVIIVGSQEVQHTSIGVAGSCAPKKAANNEVLHNPNAPLLQAEIRL